MPYLSHRLNAAEIERLIAEHGTKFFSDDMQPVMPKPGQWFREYHVDTLFGGLDVMHGDTRVQYVGEAEWVTLDASGMIPGGIQLRVYHHVCEGSGSEWREPRGDILILQP